MDGLKEASAGRLSKRKRAVVWDASGSGWRNGWFKARFGGTPQQAKKGCRLGRLSKRLVAWAVFGKPRRDASASEKGLSSGTPQEAVGEMDGLKHASAGRLSKRKRAVGELNFNVVSCPCFISVNR